MSGPCVSPNLPYLIKKQNSTHKTILVLIKIFIKKLVLVYLFLEVERERERETTTSERWLMRDCGSESGKLSGP